MTDLAKLATDVAAYAGTMTSANARWDSLYNRYMADETVEGQRQVLEELRGVLADLEAVDGLDVTYQAAIDEARAVIDAIDEGLANVPNVGVSDIQGLIEDVMGEIESLASAGAPETLAARLQRRRREARAAEDELPDEESAAADGADAAAEPAAGDEPVDDAADPAAEDDPGVFDPMAFETVEQVDAEIALYEAEIAAIHADLAGYEEIIRQLGERRDQIESGADEAVDEANAEAMAAA